VTDPVLCGARKKRGGLCGRPAGWGTEHVGYGSCKLHGGCTPGAVAAAAKAQARHLAVELEMEPHDALLWCVRVAAGEVAYATRRIQELEETDLVVEPRVERDAWGENASSYVQTSNAAMLNVWIRTRQEALDRLARFAKMALDAGVAERQVRIAEGWADRLGRLFDAVFADLDLTPAQLKKAGPSLERHLRVLEGGAAKEAA
jgi:hypothetical protein